MNDKELIERAEAFLKDSQEVWVLPTQLVQDLLTAYKALREASQWRLIDEKAKSGSYVLIGNEDNYQCVAFWNGWHWDDGDFNSSIDWATHYMPLSAAPIKESTLKGAI